MQLDPTAQKQDTAEVVQRLLGFSSQAQLWARVLGLILILVVVGGSQGATYLEIQANHTSAHQTVLGLEQIVNGLQAESTEQTKVESELRSVVLKQASAIEALARDDAINTQFRSLISEDFTSSR